MATETTRRVLVIGAGGHARVCLEALRADPMNDVVGALSRDGSGVAGLGIDVMGRDSDLENIAQRLSVTTFCVAIGDNRIRQGFGKLLTERGHQLTSAVSGSAVLSPTCSIGAGVQVLPGAVVNAATVLGDGVIVNTNATVDHDCDVGDYAHIAPAAALGGDVTVGPLALIGLGARVLPGRTIGAGAVVGAGSVVVEDVADGATVVGVPGRPVERREPGS